MRNPLSMLFRAILGPMSPTVTPETVTRQGENYLELKKGRCVCVRVGVCMHVGVGVCTYVCESVCVCVWGGGGGCMCACMCVCAHVYNKTFGKMCLKLLENLDKVSDHPDSS